MSIHKDCFLCMDINSARGQLDLSRLLSWVKMWLNIEKCIMWFRPHSLSHLLPSDVAIDGA